MTTIEWLGVGDVLTDAAAAVAAGHNWTTREHLAAAIAEVRWEDVDPDDGVVNWPMSPGLALKAILDGFKIRGVRRIGRSEVLGSGEVDREPDGWAMYQLIAVEQWSATIGRRVYVVDRGSDLVPVAYELLPARL